MAYFESNKENCPTELGTYVNLASYTSTNPYVVPSDGYVRIGAGATTGSFVNLMVNGVLIARSVGVSGAQMPYECVYVRKGAKVYPVFDATQVAHDATYYPLV